MFKRKVKSNKGSSELYYNVLWCNNHADIVSRACSVCWDKPVPKEREDKLKYIERRIKTGHESILEHSNIVTYYIIPSDNSDMVRDMTEVLSLCRYLNTNIKVVDSDYHLLIGGSIRGYKHLFRWIENPANTILACIENNLYTCSDKEYYVDFIEAGIMDENKFVNSMINDCIGIEPTDKDKDYISVWNIDPFDNVYEQVKGIFSKSDILDMVTVTVEFKNMSRTCTHQAVRHRAAITQNSQRYIDYSQPTFVSPAKYKDEYKDLKYDIHVGNQDFYVTMEELADIWNGVYKQLRDQKVMKEDARAFLLANTACPKLIMTFTYKNLIKFLELRTDTGAQKEIQTYALHLLAAFNSKTAETLGNLYKYLIPKYALIENDYSYDGIDEIIEEIETEE